MARPSSTTSFFPREHGATAMLISPFVCAAILARHWRMTELAALVAVLMAFALKDPLVALARQQWVWKDRRPESSSAVRWVAVESFLIACAGGTLLATGPAKQFSLLAAGAALFGALAIVVQVRNKQRSEWFQVASTIALTSTSVAACIAALGAVPRWGWWLWILCALQSVAGIFAVHSRLDARIASRQPDTVAPSQNRRAAVVSVSALSLAALSMALETRFWIAAALAVAAAGYGFELNRQKRPQSLVMPLKQVGQQALALSILYGALIIVGLW